MIKLFTMKNEFDSRLEEIINSNKIFWEKKYPKMGFRKKVNHWLPSIHSSMRDYGEYTGNKYNLFTKKWYLECKELEPKFDEIFERVHPRLQNFDFEEYKKRISL